MYIDVPRRLVFLDKKDTARPPCLVQYHPDTGVLSRPPCAQPDDRVWDIAHDGRRMALSGVDWLVVRGASRSRLSILQDDNPLHATDKYLSFWSRFDRSGRYVLVSVFNGKKRPVIIDLHTGEHSEPIARDLDARYGDIDPLDGTLWVPDERARNRVLTVDCASGQISKVTVPIDANVQSLRFSRDGQHVFVTGKNNRLVCCDRDGTIVWSKDMSEQGHVGAGTILFNESGSHLCRPLSQTPRCNWGEDMIIAADTGRTENMILRHQGPPGRLAADWFGDHLLTHSAEIVDFFTGAVVDRLDLHSVMAAQAHNTVSPST
ncbi:WD40 repeat domain-containing protein [Pseudomonas sp. MAFF212428]|uniref:WD40 repeat domain-containing protein n=1 Tax=Pseudomonas brassicae TaxID=2708063 RepID=A0A6B3NL88_9PSED|nr:WD40 repeat domain-containing protein [Pseudomonas brassicae]NER61078.1 WD40 repeat domain-containing protein [Pseudomonas brassicae]NER62789.1 WD40 repeat domain-containing protein [Pseudomonas brassicae]